MHRGRLLLVWVAVLATLAISIVLALLSPWLALDPHISEDIAVIAGLVAATLLPFVADPIRQLLYPKPSESPFPTKLPPGFPDPPARLVDRPAQYGRIRHLLLAKKPDSGRRSVAIIGMGGAGKTALAIVAGYDEAIEKEYRDGVLCIPAGQRPNLPELQTALAHRLGKENAAYTNADIGKADLQVLLADRACLLIIDDVWEAASLDALDCVGSRGALLFTTRDRGLAHARLDDASCVEVSDLEPQQSLELLARWASTAERTVRADKLPASAPDICTGVGNLALGVALCGGMIQADGNTPDAWDRVAAAVRRHDPKTIALDGADGDYGPDQYKYSSLYAAIDLSIAVLREEVDRQRYRELAVFAGRGPVPPEAVEALWGTDTDETAGLLRQFANRSLLGRGNKGWIILHDLLYDVARTQLTASAGGLAATHLKLVEGYRARCADGQWPDGPDGGPDGYFFENIAYHLTQAGLTDELDHLLLDYDWLRTKLSVAGIVGLLSDYSQQPRSPTIELVRSALQLSAPFLATDSTLLPQQLTGRLVGSPEPEIARLLDVIRERAPRPWLCPRTPVLNPAGGLLERVIDGHTGPVTAVAVSPDGTRIVSGSEDRTVRVWNLADGGLERTLEGHTDSVVAVAISPDGTRVVSGGEDRTVRVWNLADGRLERTLEGHTYSVTAVAISPDGTRVVSGGRDGTVRVWNLADGRLERTLEGYVVWSVAVSPDGTRIVSGSWRTVQVWNFADGRLERTLEGHSLAVTTVAASPDGKRVVSGSSDRTVRVWNLADGRLERTLEGHTGLVVAVAVSPDGTRVFSGGADGTVRVWNLADGRLERTLEGHPGLVWSVAVSPDGTRVVSGGADGTVRVWNLTASRLERTLEGHTRSVTAVAVSSDGTRVFSGGGDRTVRVWSLADGRLERTLKGHTVWSVAVYPDGTRIVSGGPDEERFWNRMNWRLERTLKGHTYSVAAMAVSPDGSRVVSGDADGTVRVWNLAAGRMERTLEGHTYAVAAVAAVAISPDGTRVVSGGGDRTVRVWNLADGGLERTLEGHTDWVMAVAVSPDGTRVFSGSSDRTVRVWSLADGRLERTLEGHPVTAIAVSPDGTRVVSGDGDGTVRVWNLADGRLVARWTAEPGTMATAVCTVPTDSSLVVYGDSAGDVHVLQLLEA